MATPESLLQKRSWIGRGGNQPSAPPDNPPPSVRLPVPMPTLPWPEPDGSAPAAAAATVDAAVAEADRAALRDELFGQGFLLPGGEREIIRLLKPLHLSAAARLMIAGIGTAGPSAVIARQLGLAVGSHDLAGEARPADAGKADPADQPASRIVATSWDPAGAGLPHAAYHHALALMPLPDGPPEPVLAQIVSALRPRGHLIMLDYVATENFDPAAEEEQEWLALEHRTAPPPQAADVSLALGRLGMHLREIEELSHLHARLTVFAWRRLLDSLPARPTDLRGQSMMAEAGGWALRVRLLNRGALRLMRWHGMLGGGGDADRGPPALA